ncbi:MAG: CCA tRNA nucleotidyltransferase [Rickettsiales bacterium]|nr:CCA tRNA nucleotidyltransferase [Rickettsiales bacterium]
MDRGVEVIFGIFGDNVRLVGGCVRDFLLRRAVSDYDFACVFGSDEIQEKLLSSGVKAIPTGKKFGTITAVVGGSNYEITTLRMDVDSDGRHAQVEFCEDFSLDAARRDFTVNALYMDKDGEIYDYFDGRDDLEKGKIRFIGDADERIKEDYLRILRFFRFSLRYSRAVDTIGFEACVANKEGLRGLSRERIRQEYFKIIGFDDINYLINVLRVMNKGEIDKCLFDNGQDVEALNKLFSLGRKYGLNVRLACLFLNRGVELENFYKEICATRVEKRYFEFLVNHKIENIDDIKILLANFDKDFVGDALAFSVVGGAISQENFEELSSFIDEAEIPPFPIINRDIMDKGFSGSDISRKLELLRRKWALSGYGLSKEDLLIDI